MPQDVHIQTVISTLVFLSPALFKAGFKVLSLKYPLLLYADLALKYSLLHADLALKYSLFYADLTLKYPLLSVNLTLLHRCKIL